MTECRRSDDFELADDVVVAREVGRPNILCQVLRADRDNLNEDDREPELGRSIEVCARDESARREQLTSDDRGDADLQMISFWKKNVWNCE